MNRHIVAFFSAAALLVGCVPAAAQSEASAETAPPIYIGDVNRDSVVDTTDARILLQAVVGKIDRTDDLDFFGDLDGDQAITTTDARLALQTAVGKQPSAACAASQRQAHCLVLGALRGDTVIRSESELADYWRHSGGIPAELADYTPAFFKTQALLLCSFDSEYDVPTGALTVPSLDHHGHLRLELPYHSLGTRRVQLLAIPLDREETVESIALRFYPAPQLSPDQAVISKIQISDDVIMNEADRAFLQIDSVEQLEAFREELEQRLHYPLKPLFLDYLAAHDDAFFEQSSLIVNISFYLFYPQLSFGQFQENADGTLTAELTYMKKHSSSMPAPYVCAYALEVNRSLLDGKAVTGMRFIGIEEEA